MAGIGKVCDHGVVSQKECKNAAKPGAVDEKSEFRVALGRGHDLPRGCILDTMPTKMSFVYWNPVGVAISNSTKIRLICRDHLNGKIFQYLLVFDVV